MAADPRLLALPALRRLAESHAREIYEATATRELEPVVHWEDSSFTEIQIDVHLRLLADLSRPESRDALARLVADRIGWGAFNVTRAIERDPAILEALYRAAGLPEPPRGRTAPPPAEDLATVAVAILTEKP